MEELHSSWKQVLGKEMSEESVINFMNTFPVSKTKQQRQSSKIIHPTNRVIVRVCNRHCAYSFIYSQTLSNCCVAPLRRPLSAEDRGTMPAFRELTVTMFTVPRVSLFLLGLWWWMLKEDQIKVLLVFLLFIFTLEKSFWGICMWELNFWKYITTWHHGSRTLVSLQALPWVSPTQEIPGNKTHTQSSQPIIH